MGEFIPVDREQMYLLPPSIHEWLPEGDLTWFLLDALEAMDLRAFYAKTKERDLRSGGRPAYEPKLLAGVLIYAYALGERSARRIERLCSRDLGFRVMAANQEMDHVTLCRFRKDHEAAMEALFLEVLRLCATAGLLKVGVVAVDGTKIKANAALSANRTKAGLEKEIHEIFVEAAKVDAEEDARFGADKRGDELPKDLQTREGRLARLKACRERLAQEEAEAKAVQEKKIEDREEREEESGKKTRGRKPKAPEDKADKEAKANATDPESRIVKTRSGYAQGYNAQATANEDQIILAAQVTQQENDVKQGPVMLALTNGNLAKIEQTEEIGIALLDAGYWSDPAAEAMESHAREVLIATKKSWKHTKEYRAQGAPKGRRPKNLSRKQAMERKLRTKRGRTLYKRRSTIIEPVFGQIKEAQRQLHFQRRGLSACDAEWKLMAACHNLLKLWRKRGANPN